VTARSEFNKQHWFCFVFILK